MPRPADRYISESNSRTRPEALRDLDRILYSTAFRRLARVTQVVSEERGHVFHNRLTHSLKVSQTARTLSASLCDRHNLPKTALDPRVAEAAALGHDLGHPPFGHTGEKTLNDLADDVGCGGFEGNAQSFRIVTKLALRDYEYDGLNLTRAVLSGILKYPWLRAAPEGDAKKRKKWGAYESEGDVLAFAKEGEGDSKSLAAEVMDWSDDITYAIHDLLDFYRVGLIPLDRLRHDSERSALYNALVRKDSPRHDTFSDTAPQALRSAIDRMASVFELGFDEPFDGSRNSRALLNRSTSYLLHTYSDAVEVGGSNQSPEFRIPDEIRLEVDLLKELTWAYVINRPSLATARQGQRKMISNLFTIYEKASANRREWSLFPPGVVDKLSEVMHENSTEDSAPHRARVILDFIAGMTEAQVFDLHAQLTGMRPQPDLAS